MSSSHVEVCIAGAGRGLSDGPTSPALTGFGRWIKDWDPEDEDFWERGGNVRTETAEAIRA